MHHQGKEGVAAGAAHTGGGGSLPTPEQIKKQKRERQPSLASSLPSSFFFRTPAHEEMPPTFRVDLLSSVKSFWKCLHRHMLPMCLLSESNSSQVDIED